jgi:hypothetical protein
MVEIFRDLAAPAGNCAGGARQECKGMNDARSVCCS